MKTTRRMMTNSKMKTASKMKMTLNEDYIIVLSVLSKLGRHSDYCRRKGIFYVSSVYYGDILTYIS